VEDQYGQWNLSVVIEENAQQKKVHFLPYKNGNRDEWIQNDESDRIREAFQSSQPQEDKESAFSTLRHYFANYASASIQPSQRKDSKATPVPTQNGKNNIDSGMPDHKPLPSESSREKVAAPEDSKAEQA
jgi:hypothetical protein